MDDDQRTTERVTTEAVIPAEPVVPVVQVAAAPVYAAPQQTYAAAPVYAAQPVMEAPVAGAPMAAQRIVTQQDRVSVRQSPLELARRIVVLAFGILQGLLILRIILLVLVANRENDIVQFILNVTAPFVNPFRDMFSLSQIGSKGAILDVAAIVAIIGWTLIELLILAVLNLGARRRSVVY